MDLVEKMKSYLLEMHSELEPYSSKWLLSKLNAHYGDSIVVSMKEGCSPIVTIRETADRILRDYRNMEKVSQEKQKRALILAAVRLLKSDIQGLNNSADFYPCADDIKINSALTICHPVLGFSVNDFLLELTREGKLPV